MTFEPIATASVAVQLHLAFAAIAVLIGPVALYRTRRDLLHKSLGRTWVGAMAMLAVSGFFIEAQVLPLVAGFGPIHLFSIWALISLTRGMRAIWRRDIAAHQAEMRGLYWQALGLAGLFTLIPGRRLNEALFRGNDEVGVWVIVAVGTLWVLYFAARRAKKAAFLGKVGDSPMQESPKSGLG